LVPKHTKVAIELRRQCDRMEPRDVWVWPQADTQIALANVRFREMIGQPNEAHTKRHNKANDLWRGQSEGNAHPGTKNRPPMWRGGGILLSMAYQTDGADEV
jgi:hypothetical protein